MTIPEGLMERFPNWDRYRERCLHLPRLGITLDLCRLRIRQSDLDALQPELHRALKDIEALEAGSVANPDEGRMVGHYWLRDPDLAPDSTIDKAIRSSLRGVKDFAARVHRGDPGGQGGRFRNALLIGIGGSALGPQFIHRALDEGKGLCLRFLDNTDPDGFDQVLRSLEGRLGETLVLVISKSGGTRETRNGMLETAHAYARAGLDFPRHAVAITGEGSRLDCLARNEGWLQRLPMWDWVGGRTSVMSAVGLLPAALSGIDIDAFLEGARTMDRAGRETRIRKNPAVQLAAAWYLMGKGERNMILLPYRDRLELLSRYLQQLVMESLGKGRDLSGAPVRQGISVFGNKGSTDQHAFVQQLMDGRNDFFVNFVEVVEDTSGIEVEEGITSGDYLFGFLAGTREALTARGRASLTITLSGISARSVGALIALYERAVGLYASLVGINAYHQPGVEAGKKAATTMIELQLRVMALLREHAGRDFSVEEIARALELVDVEEYIHHLCRRLVVNRSGSFRSIGSADPFATRYTGVAQDARPSPDN